MDTYESEPEELFRKEGRGESTETRRRSERVVTKTVNRGFTGTAVAWIIGLLTTSPPEV